VNQHEENILKFLNEATQPVDVEKVRTACGIGNWNTAHKHCLDLTLQGKIQGQKTSRGWIFWAHQNVQLKPWEEAVGTLDKVEDTDTQTIAYLTCTYRKQIAIPLPKDQPETQKLQKLIGQKVRILETDIPEKPLIIRTLGEATITPRKNYQKCLFRIRGPFVMPTAVCD
jgi:hypothetical protein